MKLKSTLSFLAIGVILGGIGFSFLSDTGAVTSGPESMLTSSALEAPVTTGKTPVVTVTDIPIAELRANAGD